MPVIELGEITTAEAPEPAAGPVHGVPDLRRYRLLALLVTVLLLLAGHASAPSAAPAVRLLWTGLRTTGDSITVAGDKAYQVSGGGRAEVVAWSLTDGTRLWRWVSDDHLISLHPAPGDGPLLVEAGPEPAGDGLAEDGPAALAARTTIALRTATGAELWRRPGAPHREAVQESSALLTEYDIRGGMSGLAKVRLEDGATLWDRTGTPVQEVTPVPAEDRVVTGSAGGEIRVLRLSDGTEVAGRTIPRTSTVAEQSRYQRLTAGNGLLMVLDFDGEDPRTTAYRLDTLKEMFPADSDQGMSSPCGAVMCGTDEDGVFAFDPVTGRELWRAGEIIASVLTKDRIFTENPYDADHVLIDNRTGRRLTGNVYGWLVHQPAYDDSLLLLRETRTPLGRTAVVRVDLHTGQSRVLGSVAPMPDQKNCQATPGYLVCLSWDEIVVAAVPR